MAGDFIEEVRPPLVWSARPDPGIAERYIAMTEATLQLQIAAATRKGYASGVKDSQESHARLWCWLTLGGALGYAIRGHLSGALVWVVIAVGWGVAARGRLLPPSWVARTHGWWRR